LGKKVLSDSFISSSELFLSGLLLNTEFSNTTWKHIDFQFLVARLKQDKVCWSKEFNPIKRKFIKIGFQCRGNGKSKIVNILTDIITYIPKAKFEHEHLKDSSSMALVHYKVLYDMLKFIQKYNPEVSSPHFKESLIFKQLQTFEELIRFISSLHHFRYVVFKLLFQNLRKEDYQSFSEKIQETIKGSYYLTDSYHLLNISPFHQDNNYQENHWPLYNSSWDEMETFLEGILETNPKLNQILKGKTYSNSKSQVIFQGKKYLGQEAKLRVEAEISNDFKFYQAILELYGKGKIHFISSGVLLSGEIGKILDLSN
jgi:hypothetical protein